MENNLVHGTELGTVSLKLSAGLDKSGITSRAILAEGTGMAW